MAGVPMKPWLVPGRAPGALANVPQQPPPQMAQVPGNAAVGAAPVMRQQQGIVPNQNGWTAGGLMQQPDNGLKLPIFPNEFHKNWGSQAGGVQPPSGGTVPQADPQASTSPFDRIGSDPELDKWLALTMGGFGMAAEAGKPGATFLGALGEGGKQGIAAGMGAAKQRREAAALKEEQNLKRMLYTSKMRNAEAAYAKSLQESLGPLGKQARDEGKDPQTDPDGFNARVKELWDEQRKSKGSTLERMIDRQARALGITDKNSNEYEALVDDAWEKATHIRPPATTHINTKIDMKKETEEHKALVKKWGKEAESIGTTFGTFRSNNIYQEGLFSGQVHSGVGTETVTGLVSFVKTMTGNDISGMLRGLGVQVGNIPLTQLKEGLGNDIMRGLLEDFGPRPTDKDMEVARSIAGALNLAPETNVKLNELLFERTTQKLKDQIRAHRSLGENLEGNQKVWHEEQTKELVQRANFLLQKRKEQFTVLDTEMKTLVDKAEAGTGAGGRWEDTLETMLGADRTGFLLNRFQVWNAYKAIKRNAFPVTIK
tara:strand:- start:10283 stop:11908 length:1626 start_codon:yes stop_codon:yes gene_type:complete